MFLWPWWITGAVEAAWLAILTRGLHLDGLADTIDGLASNGDVDRVLEIMRDSRTGAIGVVAIVLLLLIKSVCLGTISHQRLFAVLILTPCLSRFSINLLGLLAPYARPGPGLGKAFSKGLDWTFWIALPTTVLASFLLLGWQGIFALGITVFLSILAAIYFRLRIGGITGDVLGAHVEIVETVLLLSFCAISHVLPLSVAPW